jgi:hypothetical protein
VLVEKGVRHIRSNSPDNFTALSCSVSRTSSKALRKPVCSSAYAILDPRLYKVDPLICGSTYRLQFCLTRGPRLLVGRQGGLDPLREPGGLHPCWSVVIDTMGGGGTAKCFTIFRNVCRCGALVASYLTFACSKPCRAKCQALWPKPTSLADRNERGETAGGFYHAMDSCKGGRKSIARVPLD